MARSSLGRSLPRVTRRKSEAQGSSTRLSCSSAGLTPPCVVRSPPHQLLWGDAVAAAHAGGALAIALAPDGRFELRLTLSLRSRLLCFGGTLPHEGRLPVALHLLEERLLLGAVVHDDRTPRRAAGAAGAACTA